jgi:hypothetical protein
MKKTINFNFFKWLVVLAVLLGLPVASVSGQEREMTVEESYLQESTAMTLIREQVRSDDRDGKLLALDYIEELLKSGNKGDDVRVVLEGLALEGTINKTRSEGRVANNFPDVRMRAVEYLGELGTQEATDSLVKIMLVDEEPAVLTQAIRSITKIGNNEHGRPLLVVNWIFSRFNSLTPDNRLALGVVDAIEAFLPSMGNDLDAKVAKDSAVETIRIIAENHNYVSSVRQRARNVILSLYKSDSRQ